MKRKISIKRELSDPYNMDYRGRLLRAVNGAAELLLTTDDENFENSLRKSMALMARCMDIHRIYIWQNKMENGYLEYIQEFEWIDSAQCGETVLPNTGFLYVDSIPEWEERFARGECVNGPLKSLSQTEQIRLEPYGIKSILVIPVFLQNLLWGFVSFDDCYKERTFTEDEINILRSANLMMISAMDRRQKAAKLREADEHSKLMLDAMPLCCSLWDENFNLINCNAEVVNFYQIKDKREYVENFFDFSPERQPDGNLSSEKALKYIAAAFNEGRIYFEWMQKMPDGTQVPVEVTLVRVRRGDEFIVAGYTRDMRDQKKMMKALEYKDYLMNTANDVAAILLRSEIDEFETDLCRCLGMMAESVCADRMYICKNHEEGGQLYASVVYEWSGGAEPQKENLQNVSYGKEAPGWETKLSSGKCINALVRDMSPQEQAKLSPQGILSILVVPLFMHDMFWGFIGFDDCHRERLFSEDEESTLRSGSMLIANALIRNEMTHEIQAAVEQAQAASKAKSAFLAHMSHEIRTPMNVIAGMTEFILREELPAEINQYILNIKYASANMLSLINDTLDFSKIEAGSLEIISAEYALTSLINNILLIIRMKLAEKPILFTVNIDCGIPNRLIGDETRIRQIFLNILDNAAKYTDEGFISLEITGEIEEDTVVLTAKVSDSGIGIKTGDIDKLFDDFVRFDGKKNKSVQGVGLGLPIVKNLCEAMGGNISVHSEYGAGSSFTITIPQKIKSHEEKFAHISNTDIKKVLLYETRSIYAESIIRTLADLGVQYTWVTQKEEFYEELKLRSYSFAFVSSLFCESAGQIIEELKTDTKLVLFIEYGEAPFMRNVRTITMPAHAASIADILDSIEDNIFYNETFQEHIRFIAPSASILVVDDLTANLQVAQGLMIPYQMQVHICESGEEAIKYVRKKQYDIIFMDHMMPGMNGIEAAVQIRALENGNGYYENVPIIALTANAVSSVKQMFLENGVNDFLAKPIDVIKLDRILEKWIPKEKKEKCGIIKLKNTSVNMDSVHLQIEGVNIKSGISMTGGTIENYLKTLAVFHADGSEKINKIRDCVEKKDIKLYIVCAHALKSAAATIGAWKISNLFKSLEMAGTRDDYLFIQNNTNRVLGEFEKLLSNIYAVLSKNQCELSENNDPEFIKNNLLKLRDALNKREAGEINDIMTTLETIKLNQQTGVILKDIFENILLINYAAATVLVDNLLSLL